MGSMASQITSLTMVLLSCLLGRRSKKTSKFRMTACGEFTGDRWIPRTMSSNTENVSIWWRHHGLVTCSTPSYMYFQIANDSLSRAQHIPLLDGPWQVKLPVRQVDLSKVSYYVLCKLIDNCTILEVGQMKIFGYVEPWAPSQNKDRLSQVWEFPCKR